MKDMDITKRYWLFMYPTYYPMGGMHDFKGSFDSVNEVEKLIACKELEHKSEELSSGDKQFHIFDSVELSIVSYGEIAL